MGARVSAIMDVGFWSFVLGPGRGRLTFCLLPFAFCFLLFAFNLSSPSPMPPVVVASANGHQFRNGGVETCVERAFRLMTAGADVLRALVEGVTIVELDPDETSVGIGALPNADGVVELDACCMHGPRRRAGGVAALQGV